MDIREEIGLRIRKTRKIQGLTIQALSKKLGTLSAARISNWENGTRMPGPSEALILGKALNVAPSYLLCLSDNAAGDITKNIPETEYIPIIPLPEIKKTKTALKTLLKNPPPSLTRGEKITLEESKAGVSICAFATSTTDNSMTPAFSSNDILIIDCERDPRPGDYILAHISTVDENVIRKYKRVEKNTSRDTNFELIAVNTDWGSLRPTKKNKITILGTVIEQRKYF